MNAVTTAPLRPARASPGVLLLVAIAGFGAGAAAVYAYFQRFGPAGGGPSTTPTSAPLSAEARLRSMRELQVVSPNTVSNQEIEAQQLMLAQSRTELEAGQVMLMKAKAAQANGQKVAELQLEAAKANQERVAKEDPVGALQ